jgi:hypothetical protein
LKQLKNSVLHDDPLARLPRVRTDTQEVWTICQARDIDGLGAGVAAVFAVDQRAIGAKKFEGVLVAWWDI